MTSLLQTQDLVVIVPAYNEEKRLGACLEKLSEYISCHDKKWDILVVDDGSPDRTTPVAEGFQESCRQLRVISLEAHQGKGQAVKSGMLDSRNDLRAFMDADASYGPEAIEEAVRFIREGYDIVVGSRQLEGSFTDYRETPIRILMRRFFNFLVRRFLFVGIQDTQCGIKVLKGPVADRIFPLIQIKGFGFDLELLYLAKKMNYRVREIPVTCVHRVGSKVQVWREALKLFVNIFQIRSWHRF